MEYRKVKEQVKEKLPISKEFNDTENLLELGLSSIAIMRLVNQWKKQGVKVTFGALMEHPTFEEWWKLIQQNIKKIKKEKAKKNSFPEKDMKKWFPLTDIQYAYWVGREDNQLLGGIGCHAYFEFEGSNVEPERLERAWNELQYHHPMLRACFSDEGMQKIQEKPYSEKIAVNDFASLSKDQALEQAIAVRKRLSHRKLQIEKGQVAGVELTLLPENKSRLHVDIDLLIADVQSLQIILRDLSVAYNGEKLSKESKNWNFASYLQKQEIDDREEREKAKKYWKDRLKTLPKGPDIPLAKHPEDIKKATFTRRIIKIGSKEWESLQNRAKEYHTTSAMLLLTAYASVLERWSRNKKFLINIPFFNRKTEYPGVEQVVADFTTLLLLEVNCENNPTFLELLNRIQKQLHEDMKYTAYSGVQVQRDLAQIHGEASTNAPIVFACNLGTPLVNETFRENLGEFTYMISQTPQVWNDFQCYEDENGVQLTWDSVDELFPAHMIQDMLQSFEELLHELAIKEWNQNFDILPKSIIEIFEKTYKTGEPEVPQCLHTAFFKMAEEFPTKIALEDTGYDVSITYQELKERAETIAKSIVEKGIHKLPIAITLPRGYEQVVAALGILISGNIYVTVSCEQPKKRRQLIHEKTDVKYVITNEKCRMETAWPEGTECLLLEDMQECLLNNELPEVAPTDSAYIIMTSGSTGIPKGVEIAHESAWNTIEDINKKYQVSKEDKAIAVSAMDFDLSVYDLFGLLGVGGTLILLPEKEKRNADFWLMQVQKYHITIWNSVPTLLDMLLVCAEATKEKLPLRVVMLSGDWIGMDLPERLDRLTDSCKFVALGGATEASIWSNYQNVTLPLPLNWKSIPYGKPLKHQVYRVVDDFGRDCPYWVEGELWIGGYGVAKGYRGDRMLTEEKFIRDNSNRWYRTGDIGRFWRDGTIEFLGRKDYQVKIRGHRIELGEIEAAIKKIKGVKEAVATVLGKVNKQIAVYVLWEKGYKRSNEDLEKGLKNFLPQYMIPQYYAELKYLPLTSNGKIDRKQLPKFERPKMKNDDLIITQTQYKLINIWKDLFKLEEIQNEDNFFEIGGDSLIATRMCLRIQECLKVKVTISDIFKKPILKDLAQYIERMLIGIKKENDYMELPQIISNNGGKYKTFPLTDIQYSYWIGRKGIYPLGNVSSHCYFEFENVNMNIDILQNTWNRLVKQHDMLRAIILADGSGQKIIPVVPEYKFHIYDMEDESEEKLQKHFYIIREEMSHEKVDISKWPLFDIRITKYKNNVRIHFSIDNIVIDAWGTSYVLQQWAYLYNNPTNILEDIHISFADYVNIIKDIRRTKLYTEAEEYWHKRISELPFGPQLPLKVNPKDIEKQKFMRYEKRISEDDWQQIKRHAKTYGFTPSNVLMAAYANILSKWSKNVHFLINITLFNRIPVHKEINKIIGDFTSILLLEINKKEGRNFIEDCRVISEQLAKDMEHSLYDGIQVQRLLANKLPRNVSMVAPVVFTSTIGVTNLGETDSLGKIVYNITQTPQIWLDHQVREEKGELLLQWEVVEGLFEKTDIEYNFQEYINSIKSLSDERKWEEISTSKDFFEEGVL